VDASDTVGNQVKDDFLGRRILCRLIKMERALPTRPIMFIMSISVTMRPWKFVIKRDWEYTLRREGRPRAVEP
jgi:hypothetical protein